MLAAQVNIRKHDKLRMILGFEWSWCLGFCEALLGWVVIAAAAAGRVRTGDSGPKIHPPPLRAGGSCGSPLPCVRIGRRMDDRRIAFVFGVSGGPLSRM